MKYELTDAALRPLRPGPERDGEEHWDTVVKGLHLIVSKTAMTWKVRYVLKGTNTKKRPIIGTYPTLKLTEARQKAAAFLERVEGGHDPDAEKKADVAKAIEARTEKPKPEYTFAKLVTDYVAYAVGKGKVSAKDEHNSLKFNALPDWADLAPDAITKKMVTASFMKVKDRGSPISANRYRAALQAVFRYAVDDKLLLEVSPVDGTKKPSKETSGEEVGRVMDGGELRVVLTAIAASDMEATTKGAFLLLALTGQRPIEVCGLEVAELRHLDNAPQATIEFPASRYKKGKRTHLVPLSQPSIDLIKRMLEMQAEEDYVPLDENDTGEVTHVFASRFNNRAVVSQASLPQAMRRLIEDMEETGPDAAIIRGLKADRPTPHSFRRSVGTGLEGLNEALTARGLPTISDSDVEAVLGHKPTGVTKRHYNKHQRLNEKRYALNCWAEYIMRLLSGEADDGRVTVMRKRPENDGRVTVMRKRAA